MDTNIYIYIYISGSLSTSAPLIGMDDTESGHNLHIGNIFSSHFVSII